MINLQNVKAKSGSTWHTLCPFPVGFIYMSYTNTSPANTFGGGWTPITGRFLYANSTTATGGANTHTLSNNEIPSHSHSLRGHTWSWGQLSGGTLLGIEGVGNVYVGNPYSSNSLATVQNVYNVSLASGSGSSHNNMPQYQSCYCWRRTS